MEKVPGHDVSECLHCAAEVGELEEPARCVTEAFRRRRGQVSPMARGHRFWARSRRCRVRGLVHQDVGRLQVRVQEALLVQEAQARGHLHRDSPAPLRR